MLENSVDAGATNVDIVLKDGGIKMLQITDNGHGIDHTDLPILCQRFTTSKLTKFEDLQSIATYGFRGEALASISHISQLSVTTMTANDKCSWKAEYIDGKMLKEAKPSAGRPGTSILVENLFYNTPSRLRTLRGPNDEFLKVVDVMGKYAIHSKVGISVKKFGESKFALQTRANSTTRDKVRTVFGNVGQLIDFSVLEQEEIGIVGVSGLVSDLEPSNKKGQFVLFINDRLVSCDPLRRAMTQVYTAHGCKAKPFIYLDLKLAPQILDVNVHPTKREVRFLHEVEIIDVLSQQLQSELSQLNSSRSFKTAVLKPQPTPVSGPILSTPAKRTESRLVRTDSSQKKITAFTQSFSSSQYAFTPRQRSTTKLTSVLNLREQVDASTHTELTQILTKMTYVGVVDSEKRLMSFQHDLKLFLCDYSVVLYELFYQICLTDFANFGKITFAEGIELAPLLGADSPAIEQLSAMSEMLQEYFSIGISQGRIWNVPLLLKNYAPPLSRRLAQFIVRLAHVDWSEEEKCLNGIMSEIARLYTPVAHSDPTEVNTVMEDVLVPCIKRRFIAPQSLATHVIEIANLPGLYKVFERC